MIFAKVAVENTVYHFDKVFDYLVPPELEQDTKPGCRVMIPFGSANHKRLGMVLSLSLHNDYNKIKPIIAVLDQAPLLSSKSLCMVTWIKERYFCTLFEAVKLLLPTGINLKIKTEYSLAIPYQELQLDAYDEIEQKIFSFLSHVKKPVERGKLLKKLDLTEESPSLEKLVKLGILQQGKIAVRQVGDAMQKMVRLIESDAEPPKLTPKQISVCNVLRDVGSVSVKELCYFTGVTTAVIHTLVSKGILEYYEFEAYRNPYENIIEPQKPEEIILSDEQQKAFSHLRQEYFAGKGGASLLFGVTGSGKTSVFMRLIDEVLSDGRNVIVMVPEISLTPQTIGLFHRRYGKDVSVFHSALSLAERLDEWKRVKRGKAKIAVGTRSAIFAPFENIGLIIMDEEQEYTYKSESSPRYHARDIAKYRCVQNKALLVLCSATPSLESYYYAQTGRYGFDCLTERYGNATLPEVRIVDMNRELEYGNSGIFSCELIDGLKENLKNNRQSIILLNRRGYNTFVACKACGHVVTCPHCSISLTYHAANQRLMCHYCGYSTPFSDECPECHERKVHYAGFGTQKGEEQLQELFPHARILRLDADSAVSRFAYEKKLKAFSDGKYDMIIGTQMVAKGLDFENVTLVGVLSADQTLYGNDFRSSERAFGLLTQVVGRSGRGQLKGTAMIQTYTPENEIFSLAAQQDYPAFYEGELAMRKAMLYPPFADICVVGFVGGIERKVANASNEFLAQLSSLAQKEYAQEPMRVLKPSPALITKVSNKYRYKLIVKCRNTHRFRDMISRLLVEFAKQKEFSQVTAYADINPDMIL